MEPLTALPGPNRQRIAIRITPQAEHQLRGGHPWLFENAITSISHQGAAGDIAVIFDRKNRFLAAGLYEPQSPIRVRIFVHGQPQTIDKALFSARIHKSIVLREPLRQSNTNAYRLVHGANDRLPGLIVDRYDQTLVVKLYAAGWIPHLTPFLDALCEQLMPQRVVLRLSRSLQTQPSLIAGLYDGQPLRGRLPEQPVTFVENGIQFEADVVHGQKTGFFLDQRENRKRVEQLARSRRMLNAFSYSGGFSVYAARGGATRVTDVDLSAPALEAARLNMVHNRDDMRISAAAHETIHGDVFSVLTDFVKANRRFDLVVLDPPAFARRESDLQGALQAYNRLACLGLNVLESGGILVASSCSSRVSAEMFFNIIHTAARTCQRSLVEIERTGHALDHPIGFKEGAYLKTIFAWAY